MVVFSEKIGQTHKVIHEQSKLLGRNYLVHKSPLCLQAKVSIIPADVIDV